MRNVFMLIASILSIAMPAGSSAAEPLFAHESPGHNPGGLLCGPRSLRIAFLLLGVDVSQEDILAACQVTEQGTSFLSLKNASEAFGVEARGVRMEWKDLVQLDGPAILHVNGNHFRVFDRVERESRAVRMFDPDKGPEWYDEESLEGIWDGYALVLNKNPDPACEQMPFAAIDRLLEDFGTKYTDERTSSVFVVRNVGSAPLTISLEKNCVCTSARIDKEILAPDEEARITVELDLKGRMGRQEASVQVISNDPLHPEQEIHLTGNAKRDFTLSRNAVEFSGLHSGTKGQEYVDVLFVDDWFDLQNIKITPAEPAGGVDFTVKPEKIEFGGQRGYRLLVNVVVSDDSAAQRVVAEIEMVIEGTRRAQIRIPVVAHVRKSLDVYPKKSSVGMLAPGLKASRKFQMVYEGGEVPRLIGWTVQPSILGEIIECQVVQQPEAGRAVLDITMVIPASGENEDGLVKRIVALEFKGGQRSEVTLVGILRPENQERGEP